MTDDHVQEGTRADWTALSKNHDAEVWLRGCLRHIYMEFDTIL
jgi:hypothetical protein